MTPEYLTGEQVMKRWNIQPNKLYGLIKAGLGCYTVCADMRGGYTYKKSNIGKLIDFNEDWVVSKYFSELMKSLNDEYYFLSSDIERFEIDHPELKNHTERGRHKKEKVFLEAKTKLSEFIKNRNGKIKKAELEKEYRRLFPDRKLFPDVMLSKIWTEVPKHLKFTDGSH